MRSRRVLVPVLLASALALAGCSADGGGEFSEPAADRGVTAQEEAAEDSGAAPGGSPTAPMAGTREVIVTGYLTMTVEDPRAASAEVARVVEAAGGWVEARSERAGTEREDPTASLTVRIPSAALSQSLTQIEALGEVTQFDQNSEDVTMTARDLDARIRAMEISVERLTTMLEQAATTQDVINAEQTLTDRQAQLESLQSQRAYLREQVAMSTLHVTLWTPADAPEVEPEREGFWGGLLKSWDAMVASAAALVHVLGILIPWAVLGGLIAAVVVWWRRRVRARRPQPPAAPGWPAGYPVGPAGPQQPMAYAAAAPQPAPAAAPAATTSAPPAAPPKKAAEKPTGPEAPPAEPE